MWGWLMVGLSGLIHISTANNENKNLSKILKPITLLLLMAILVTTGREEPQFIWVAIGLSLAVIADTFSVLPKISTRASFIALILSFLFYSKGFWSLLQGDITWWLPSLLFAGSIILILLLLPKLDTIIFPVSIMGLVLVQMSWVACAVWMNNTNMANLYACLACFVFVAATLISAVNIYRHPFPKSDLWATSGFFIAHSLTVASVIA